MTEASLKLHLGCGPKYIPGFLHVDALDFPHVDVRGPVDILPFAKDQSVEMIYACHVLEHFGRYEINRILAEWYRVLKPGGVLRLAVPNFEAVAKLYVLGRLQNGLDEVMGLIVGGQKDEYDYHKVAFDGESLTQRLKSVGFSTVRGWDWRETEHSALDDYSQAYLPHMDKTNGTLVSLNIEGVR
ncbi:class I SAM-dependent methyltransferase [Hansschlegelia zhihuaiae]|uniref:Methyltransferase domain-containing protein n=1 Tax=Hansschlegelia zhihuaiae TaxID=405005 RepID=A0A4Q0MN03_9HYPH|nr:methyltransferase domain-containing protein [Hansschlegelia zhihuaiae]RXF74449.1 methyltransferase domain-containing protein [Hansschlegelia zhihuaiae]